MQVLYPAHQIDLLKCYIKSLQLQNNTKDKQRQTLYVQLDSLNTDYHKLQNKLANLKNQASSHSLNKNHESIIIGLSQQIQLLKSEQEHLFNQNIQILQNLQINQRRINELEDENYNLRKQKQELQKFRVNLDKISFSLQFIQKEKQELMKVNYQLMEQNNYFRQVIENYESQFKGQNHLAKSFQKIQEYDEQFQESHESSQKINCSKPQKQARTNLHDYLMEELSRSYEMNESLDKSKNQHQLLQPRSSQNWYQSNVNVSKSQICELKKSKMQQNNGKQESCDVIHDMYDELSHEVQKRQPNFLQSTVKLDQLRKDRIELQKRLEQSLFQNEKLQNKIKEMVKVEAINIKQMQNDIQKVSQNYQKIQRVVNQKQKQIEQMYEIIQNLQRDNQQLGLKLYQKDQVVKQSIKTNRKSGQNSILSNITKQTLVKQNNMLIQMINGLERQKNQLYIKLNHGKQNYNNLNKILNLEDLRLKQTVDKIEKRVQNKSQPDPKKNAQLKKRIQRIKLQNQIMLQSLSIQ